MWGTLNQLTVFFRGLCMDVKDDVTSKNLEDEVKKAKTALLNRFLYAVLVFCVVWIVTLVMGAISKIGINDTDTTSWSTCWDLIMKS